MKHIAATCGVRPERSHAPEQNRGLSRALSPWVLALACLWRSALPTTALLLTLLGGGASSASEPVLLTCNDGYHSGTAVHSTDPPLRTYLLVFVLDCEANGVNDGPGDTDESDPADERWFWDYRITDNCFDSDLFDSIVPGDSYSSATNLMSGTFSVTAGQRYAVTEQDPLLNGIGTNVPTLAVDCSDGTSILWDSGPLPDFTAATDSTCSITLEDRLDMHPAPVVPRWSSSSRRFCLWHVSQTPTSGCGIGPELLAVLPLLRAWRKR